MSRASLTYIRACMAFLVLGAAACGAKAPPRAPVKTKKTDTTIKTPDLMSSVWQSMGFDSTNTYFSPNEKKLSVDTAKDLKELWRFTVQGFPSGTAAIAIGRVYITATGGTYALNLNTGEQLWARPDLLATSSPAYYDGGIFVHVAGANVYKLDAKTGKTVWGPMKVNEHGEADAYSSPIVANGKVLVGRSTTAEVTNLDPDSARGGVAAFDAADGTPLWTYYTVPETGENGASVWSSVAIDPTAKVAFAATGNNYTVGGDHSDAIHAIDLDTGDPLWHTQARKDDVWAIATGLPGMNGNGPDFDFGANPILAEVDGRKLVADGNKGGEFYVMDRETGELVWSRLDLTDKPTATNGGIINNGGFDGYNFYVVANQPQDMTSKLYALDARKEGQDAWPPAKIGVMVWGSPTIANGVVVVPAGTAINFYDSSNGDLLNSFETGGDIAGAAAIVDGKVVVKSGVQVGYAATTNNDQIICYGFADSGS